MIAKSYILSNLNTLDHKYRSTTSRKEGLFYSKLAILELCGWIEESMDDIILRCSTKHLRENNNLKDVHKRVVEKTYGFDYNTHFRNMLIKILGYIGLEKLERKADPIKLHILKSTLGDLKARRDAEAHTHIKGITRQLDAPSVTKQRFIQVYDGLIDLDSQLRTMRARITFS